MAVRPYLAFAGTCRAAFTRYHEVLGGDVVILGFADLPPDAEGPPPGVPADSVMHAALMLPDGGLVMGADDMGGGYEGTPHGFCVNLSVADGDEVRRIFAALSEGGSVQQEPSETFFSPAFSMCTDRFGVPWMVMVDGPQPAS
jgi:PhnB protein